jgi:hypothetical protein
MALESFGDNLLQIIRIGNTPEIIFNRENTTSEGLLEEWKGRF